MKKICNNYIVLSIPYSLITILSSVITLGVVSTNNYDIDVLFLSLRHYWSYIIVIWVIYSIIIFCLAVTKLKSKLLALLSILFVLDFCSFFFVVAFSTAGLNQLTVLTYWFWFTKFLPVMTFFLGIYLLINKPHLETVITENISINQFPNNPKPASQVEMVSLSKRTKLLITTLLLLILSIFIIGIFSH